jgi:hypothetical protein
MKHLAVALIIWLIVAQPACAQVTPPEAQATLTVARAQATAASAYATANAPTATVRPTATPVPPTSTPWPTVTAQPTAQPTATMEPTATAQPSAQATATAEPAMAAAQPTTQAPQVNAPARGRTIYDDWPLLFLLGIGALAMIVGLSRLIDGKTITLPGRGKREGRDDR